MLDTIPGVTRVIAENIVAEISTDMSHFPTANHLAFWAGVAPGNNESAGMKYSGKAKKGSKLLGVTETQVAHAVTHTKDTYLRLNITVWQEEGAKKTCFESGGSFDY